jgi:hypothetical protein
MTNDKTPVEQADSFEEKETNQAVHKKGLVETVLEFAFFILGGVLAWFGVFGEAGFLKVYFATLDIASWSVYIKIALIATILIAIGWGRIFWGFLTHSLNEYEEALSARFMRMTSFLAVFLWVLAYLKSEAVSKSFYIAFLKFVKFGQFNFMTLLGFVALILLTATTVYFTVRWIMLRFFERW